jgi:hypothetical protein
MITKLALTVGATVAAAVALPATAHADDRPFQSPSGNIVCLLSNSSVACEISDYTYQLPPPPPCAQHVAWGNRFTLEENKTPELTCHGDTLRIPGEPTLHYGHTVSGGTITCDSEPTEMKCTDANTGHYFRISRDSYDLG